MSATPSALTPPDPFALAALSRTLALEAGEAILRLRGCATKAKADGSPVTEADLAANAILEEGLRSAYPKIPIVTEEREADHASGAPAEIFFLLDPLDGTKDYARGGEDFTVNLALIVRGAPWAGVVYAPAHDRLYRSLPEGGAEEETPSTGLRRALRVRRGPQEPLTAVFSKSHEEARTRAWLAERPGLRVVQIGSSLKFCLVASGEADVYPRLSRIREWDIAAGDAVLRAAGGVAQDLAGAPLLYGAPGFVAPEFLAFAPSYSDSSPQGRHA
ncbi:3'(2'),5'-bisphosphate nucleotidase CysQ family protein [Neomegalonema perideroedes]|uniref:3'(2'),5'-bisphosphate nucleotidase CysQ family protein n=1 Tax=Neomegalonema perideroedes TaxID=217219 RepID=UPI000366E15B|nr:3'(2'),5'-bisphosphate nucleotidase CysQ [Neomegalonema perideroedes]